jgi:hypothetical protein
LIFSRVGHFLPLENSTAPPSVDRTVQSSSGTRKLSERNLEGVPNDVPEASSIHHKQTRSPAEPPSPPVARAGRNVLRSSTVGALPILDDLLRRMRLEEFLRAALPPEDRRTKLSPVKALLVLLRNLLVSREPIYGVGEWAARHATNLLGLKAEEIGRLNDNCVGRALDRLFLADVPSLVLAVATHVVKEFGVCLDELHNDSTTVSFCGAYASAAVEQRFLGRPTLAITSAEGYRLVWYHSLRKAELDAVARSGRIERALKQLATLREKLRSPRTRYRQEAKVTEAVAEILQSCGAGSWIVAEVQPQTEETFHQDHRGRPGKDTRYVKKVATRFDLVYRIDDARVAADATSDGIFPLVTNVVDISELELLKTYKRQPAIEKRFSQLKTDFEVAPVYLKAVHRIQALLCVYFFALLAEALLERELRQAMQRDKIEALPMYPEGRACRWPTARRVIDLFELVQRHTFMHGKRPAEALVTELTRLQRKLLKLLGLSAKDYGR